jgi:hypothetical protein
MERGMDIQDVVQAAWVKFGDVLKVIRREDGEYFVACKRREPVFPDRPYMTITAGVREDIGEIAFYWGHYDITALQVHVAIAEAEAVSCASNSGLRRPKPAKRPMTNIEKVTHLMTYSSYGALSQMFVMEALQKWSDIISSASIRDVDNGFINPEAWIAVAKEIRERLQTEMLIDDPNLDDEESA